MTRHVAHVHDKRPHKQLEKKFKCDQCSYMAAQKCHLKDHVSAVHERKSKREIQPSSYCKHNRQKQSCKDCNPMGHHAKLLRWRLHQALKHLNGTKSNKTEQILGCTFKEFEAFLQTKVTHWNNSFGFVLNKFLEGDFELDHIKPISLAKTKEEVEQLKHFTNSQLIWKSLNQKKFNKWSDIDEKFWKEEIYLNPDHYNFYVPNQMWSDVYSLY